MSRVRTFFGAIAAVAGSLIVSVSLAQAACYSQQQALPSQTVDQFTANPSALLSQYPNGGAEMISRIRDLAASSPATLNAIIALLANASPDQQKAIGTGLGQAALVCVKTDQPYASQIQQAVIASNNNNAIVALNAVLGDRPITAAGPGIGGGGGQTSSYSGSAGAGGGTSPFGSSRANTATNFFTSSLAGSSPGSTTTTSGSPQ